MSSKDIANREPSVDQMESLFVNNENLDQLEAYLNRFNPIKVMKMERMEIRHSAILAWLLDPSETHGLGDHFLKAFLGEALRGFKSTGTPMALDIIQSDLRDAEVRSEWQNIDIFIVSPTNNWAFIIENKFHSKQHKGQLDKYMSKVNSIYKTTEKSPSIAGIFLTLGDEEPEDERYAPIKYEAVCEILDRMLLQQSHVLSTEVTTFLNHYLDILKDATGMSDEFNEMEKLARQLYRDHKKVLDFVVEHGASTDFAIAARTKFGDDPDFLDVVTIKGNEYVFGGLNGSNVWFLPRSWYEGFGENEYNWAGCNNWWMEYPLIIWIQITSNNDGIKGLLRLHAEVGRISIYEFRKELIESIKSTSAENKLARIKFQKGADSEGKKYSKFLKDNSVAIKDIQNPDEISSAIEKLLKKFQPEFEAVAKILPKFLKYGEGRK